MSSSTTLTTLNRRQLYLLTNGILNAHSFHFITISLLFTPFIFSASAAVQFYSSSNTMFDPFFLFLIKTIISSSQSLLTIKTLITLLTFCCSVVLPTVAGVALITYSTNQAIHHKPLTFSATVKSLSHSYIPTLYTFIAGSINLIIISLAFTLSPIAITESIKALGFHFDLTIFSIFINSIVSYALAIAIGFLIVIWGSASAITVLESKSGFETLQQSANQKTEFQRHSFSIVFITGFAIIPALLWSSIPQKSTEKWMSILHVGAIYLQSLLMILHYVVANTVLYVQYRVAIGEEIATTTVKGEVSGEYVRLVVNDNEGEVVHDLAKESGRGSFSYMMYLLIIVWIIILVYTVTFAP